MFKSRVWENFMSFKFNSILIKNFVLIFLLIAIPIMTITYTVQNRYMKAVESEIRTANYNSLLRMKETIDRALSEGTRLATYLSISEGFELYFAGTESFVNEYELVKDLKRIINNYRGIYDYIDSIYLDSPRFAPLNGEIYNDIEEIGIQDTTLESNGWYKEDKEDEMTFNRYIAWQENRSGHPNNNYLTIVHYVRDASRDYQGSVAINMRSSYLANMIELEEEYEELALIVENQSGKIILSKGQKLFLESVDSLPILGSINNLRFDDTRIVSLDNKRYIISVTPSDHLDWTYISIVPLVNYSNNVDAILAYVRKQIMIYLIICLVLSYLLTVKTYEPISEIMKIIENPSLWNGKVKSKKGELHYISDNILKIVMSNDSLEGELRKKIELLDKAQNKALQSQMNPHFLYNTLELINFEAMEIAGGQNNASRMISDLSEMLRYSLDGELYGTLENEIGNVKHYLEIMKNRNQGNLDYEIDLEEGISQHKYIKLSIQPLVENAIYHGVKPKRGKGYISVRGYLKQSNLIVEVKDNGRGMTSQELETLRMRINDKYVLRNEGIGLYNVNQRIKIVYGEAYGITIDSEESNGTTVKLVVPYM